MTVKTAKSAGGSQARRLVVFVIYPDIVLLDLVGPLQVFSHALDPVTEQQGYECVVVSMAGGLVETNTVVPCPSDPVCDLSGRDIHSLVVVGGDGALIGMHDPKLVETVKTLAKGAQRVCSVCSGALILAAAGLLDGRRAVTHWDDCKLLAEAFPGVEVELDPIFVNDGPVWTSAGVTAGIDMALAIVSQDLGRAAALAMARSMVVQMARSGGQSQFSPTLGRQMRDKDGRFERLHEWIAENIAAQLSVVDLAQNAGMSPRNFARVYTRVMGETPAKAVQRMRVEKARDLLENTSQSIKQIALGSGFLDEDRMRRAFLKALSVTPTEYRRNFQIQ